MEGKEFWVETKNKQVAKVMSRYKIKDTINEREDIKRGIDGWEAQSWKYKKNRREIISVAIIRFYGILQEKIIKSFPIFIHPVIKIVNPSK